MVFLQVLKDIDDIDHLTLEKHGDHFTLKRIADDKFSMSKAEKLLKHIELWYPETAEAVKQADLNNANSVYTALRNVRDIIINSYI